MLHAPLFADPEAPCDTTIRNEELVAHFALPRSGRTITAQLGSEHPGPGDSYAPVRLCDELPHIYDGFVWLYSCEDELTWQGTLTIRRR